MPSRSIRWRGFSARVTVPERAAQPLRKLAPQRDKPVGTLEFRDPPPLKFHKRSVADALEFREVAHDAGREQVELAKLGDDDLSKQVAGISWYHTIDLPDGVTTPGQFDHRTLVSRYGFPSSLKGMRALDVATFNGFWAFELEKLGAEVTAIDLDDPIDWDFPNRVKAELSRQDDDEKIGSGFEVAKKALSSTVNRVSRSVYDLDPAVDGTFDFVHCGDVLVHLRDPLRALEAIRSVCTGEMLLSDGVDIDAEPGEYGPTLQYRGGWSDVVWWVPSADALAQLVIDAGFSDIKVNAVYNLAKTNETSGYWRVSMTAVV